MGKSFGATGAVVAGLIVFLAGLGLAAYAALRDFSVLSPPTQRSSSGGLIVLGVVLMAASFVLARWLAGRRVARRAGQKGGFPTRWIRTPATSLATALIGFVLYALVSAHPAYMVAVIAGALGILVVPATQPRAAHRVGLVLVSAFAAEVAARLRAPSPIQLACVLLPVIAVAVAEDLDRRRSA